MIFPSDKLKDLKYELRVDTFDEALRILIQEHREKEGKKYDEKRR